MRERKIKKERENKKENVKNSRFSVRQLSNVTNS